MFWLLPVHFVRRLTVCEYVVWPNLNKSLNVNGIDNGHFLRDLCYFEQVYPSKAVRGRCFVNKQKMTVIKMMVMFVMVMLMMMMTTKKIKCTVSIQFIF